MSQIMQNQSLDNVNTSRKHVHSLNYVSRKKQMRRINTNNQIILKRLQTIKPYCE